jgi:DNA-binding transcriptional regulator GbsR (MarR family)
MISRISATPPALDAAREPLLDALAQTFALYGWSEVMGRIYGLLAFADEPLSQNDLAQLLAVSNATISTSMGRLESLHFVYRVENGNNGTSGGRPRLFYRAERDFKKVVHELLYHNVQQEVELMAQGIDESRRRLQLLGKQANDALGSGVAKDLALVDQFEGYLRLGRTVRWLVQSAERFQGFLSSLHPNL